MDSGVGSGVVMGRRRGEGGTVVADSAGAAGVALESFGDGLRLDVAEGCDGGAVVAGIGVLEEGEKSGDERFGAGAEGADEVQGSVAEGGVGTFENGPQAFECGVGVKVEQGEGGGGLTGDEKGAVAEVVEKFGFGGAGGGAESGQGGGGFGAEQRGIGAEDGAERIDGGGGLGAKRAKPGGGLEADGCFGIGQAVDQFGQGIGGSVLHLRESPDAGGADGWIGVASSGGEGSEGAEGGGGELAEGHGGAGTHGRLAVLESFDEQRADLGTAGAEQGQGGVASTVPGVGEQGEDSRGGLGSHALERVDGAPFEAELAGSMAGDQRDGFEPGQDFGAPAGFGSTQHADEDGGGFGGTGDEFGAGGVSLRGSTDGGLVEQIENGLVAAGVADQGGEQDEAEKAEEQGPAETAGAGVRMGVGVGVGVGVGGSGRFGGGGGACAGKGGWSRWGWGRGHAATSGGRWSVGKGGRLT